MVSILVLMDILLLLKTNSEENNEFLKVSILVLMDILLLPYFCENPLFISVTDFFSDIKITIFELIFIIFCCFLAFSVTPNVHFYWF